MGLNNNDDRRLIKNEVHANRRVGYATGPYQ